ncbi:27171_t:CDS:2 [Racocetra persica]|uniref:27171_t:CDS:1 n=1 Tax=Racocetra persica TaxID=160502 RepID=A0ACA9KG70_9GLOM|nr:27171_t:CDS:2 [Racocetra persica]
MKHTNSYLAIQPSLNTSSAKNNLFFQDEIYLVQWLEMRKDIILQALNSIFLSPPIISNQVSNNLSALRFIASAVWEKLLKKYIDILDYDIFIKQQSGVKVLVKLVARSLKIYVEYLIAKSKGENSDYAFMVLNHIKELDNITIDIGFLAATNNDTQSNNNTQSDNDTQADNNTQANYNIQVENNQQSYNNN